MVQARAFCAASGGDLVQWNNAEEQMLVERHMRANNSLTQLYYWQGVRRASAAALFTYVDGSSLPQVAQQSPYALWDWQQRTAAATSGYDCAMAFFDTQYDLYLGDGSPEQQTNSSRWGALAWPWLKPGSSRR
jgi:hypothetical protein